jgi:hypothetical protein
MTLFAYTPDGNRKWSFKAGGELRSGCTIAGDGMIYFTAYNNTLYQLDAAGKRVWSFVAGSFVYAPPIIAPSGAIYLSQTDTLTALGGNILAVGNSNSSRDFQLSAVYPNPADARIGITIPKGLASESVISIVNSLGQEVKAIMSTNSARQSTNIEVSTAELANGVYSVQFRSASGAMARSRFVVQH